MTLDCNCSSETYTEIILYSVPIVGIIFGTTLLFFLFYWWHKQRIELIRSNQFRSEKFDLRTYSFFLGLLLTFTGLSISIVFILVLGRSLALLGGLVPFAIGLGLLTYYKMTK
ncbi:hypothetical protein [Leptospira sp. GIMC2001]|uniref:hypothetical protein n=1 Tax=Leptospira sp. GIMC2001 TaxID=1513297 RepID=UPI00234A306E|nr:hypothetical protein [Leptospira sp. GIMC2001]WCL51401.1 hypothetical protein O4O04_16915 [Leptospira sp. GIMC2001]